MLPDVAVIANPGAPERNGEQASIANALDGRIPLALVEPPGTLDGGDVLKIDRVAYVGVGGRTNDDAMRITTQAVSRLAAVTSSPCGQPNCELILIASHCSISQAMVLRC